MAQPSVAKYFNSRKRPAVDDYKKGSAKILKLNEDVCSIVKNDTGIQLIKKNELQQSAEKRPMGLSICSKQGSLKECTNTSEEIVSNNLHSQGVSSTAGTNREQVIPPSVSCDSKKDLNLNQIKLLICKSAKLNKLKESIQKFQKSAGELKKVEEKTRAIEKSPIRTIKESPNKAAKESPKLGAFQSIEFEVAVGPQGPQSPEKPYLSPKKANSVRRNLLATLSPKKNISELSFNKSQTADNTEKSGLQLSFKYKTLNEMFRAIDTVVQILHNRKECVSFKKLKPAVEEMVKRTFLQKHLAQIKFIYPTAYEYEQQQVRCFDNGLRKLQWDLVLKPIVNAEVITSQILLDRRRAFQGLLIERIKTYHNEFLLSLTPPIVVSKQNITRWHPEFDIEKVPEIELADMPQAPTESCLSGREVLESARRLFNCNTRMNQALLNLKEVTEKKTVQELSTATQTEPVIIKGIPKALLEKVRQKQMAKALMSMTRTADKDKEVSMYCRLPEIARLIRNLFVTEKKSVLELAVVLEKLGNSYRTTLTKIALEDHLKAISAAVPKWLVFHTLRGSVFLKLDKSADLSLILTKLQTLAREKQES